MNLLLSALILLGFTSAAFGQMRPREETKWDQLTAKTACLRAPVPEGIKLKDGYTPQVKSSSRTYWIDSQTKQETENPWFSSDPALQEAARRNQFAWNMPGGGDCPLGLSQQTKKDTSWTRSNGEIVTVTVEETYKCTDNPRAVKNTRQKVYVKHAPATAQNSNLSRSEEDALIAEGIRLAQEESSRRLDNSELSYASISDARGVSELDRVIEGYLVNGNCTGGNSRVPSQETAAARFCEARQSALLSINGNLTERDRQCPSWLPRTMSEILTASRATPACTGTSIMPGQGEVSKCVAPAGFNGQVGQEENGCRILSFNDYPNGYRDISISCTPGTLPRLPGAIARQATARSESSPTEISTGGAR